MLSIPLLARVARRLQEVWVARSRRDASPEHSALRNLATCQQALRQARHRMALGRAHGLTLILPELHQNLRARAQDLGGAVDELRRQLERPAPDVPTIPFLVAELRQVEDEFHGLRIDWKQKTIGATTEPITLRGVALGPFEIQLYCDRLTDLTSERCFDVVALEPNPPVANDRVTHPHVKDDTLCAGNATIPLLKALEQGRIADAFCLVRSVLTHYNPGSPHVSLDAWGGLECSDCACSIDDDEAWSCEGCGDDLCADCREECTACGSIRCATCLQSCAVCHLTYCHNCLKPAAGSNRRCCARCLVACSACDAQIAKDELVGHGPRCTAKLARPGAPVNPLISPTPDSLSETANELPTAVAAAP
jgi:hypothetical protein